MAIPENGNPNRTPTHVDDIGDQRAVESSTRGGWRWWWIWPVVVALAFWWAGWGWGGTGGWWWGRAHSQNTAITAPAGARTTETAANAGAQQPATSAGADAGGARATEQMSGPGVQVLDAQNKKAFIGEYFAANHVPVEQKVNDHALWIGGNNPMLAVVSSNGNSGKTAQRIDSGKMIDAKGSIKKAPPSTQAKREWALSDQDASRLEHEGAYIEVSQLTVPQQ